MSTDYTEHIDEAMRQLPNNPAVVPADNRTPQSPNITLEAWNRLQARLVTLETLVAKLGKGGFATAVQEDVSALGSDFSTSVSDAVEQANAYTDDAVEAERDLRNQAIAAETARATAAENSKVPKTAESRRIYATDANGVTTTYPWSVSRTAYNTNGDKNSFVRRNEGRIPGIADPSDDYDAANKKYVDAAVSAKVDKNPNPDTYPRALTSRLLNGVYTETYQRISHLADASTIAARDGSGHLATASPTQDYHAANRQYVDTVVASQVGRTYKPAGNISFAELINTVSLDSAHLGNIYNIRNAFTTTNDFLEGPGIEYPANTNVGVVQDGSNYRFDTFMGQIDLSDYYTKSEIDDTLQGSYYTQYDVDNLIDGVVQDEPFEKGTGHDSAVLKATPNAADPSVVRTNTVTGDFSTVLAGSRNNISATESAAAGGIITITGGGNNFGSGYRQTMTDCENSTSNGYRNTLDSCAQVKVVGRGLNLTYCSNGIFAGYDITCTGTGGDKREGNALFGRDVSSTGSYGLSAGLHTRLSNSCAAAIGDNLLTSKYGQTNVGMWNKANNQAYFVVGSGQSEAARKNCFAAGWDGNGTTEEERKVIWIGNTKLSEAKAKTWTESGVITLTANAWYPDVDAHGNSVHLQDVTLRALGSTDHIQLTPISSEDETRSTTLGTSVTPMTGSLRFSCTASDYTINQTGNISFVYFITHKEVA